MGLPSGARTPFTGRHDPSVAGVVLLALAVPPLLVAAGGGGQLALGPLRLAFYDLSSAALGLIGALLWLGRRRRGGGVEGVLSALSLGALAFACLLAWSPPTGAPGWLQVKPGRPLIIGWLALGLAARAGRRSGRPLLIGPLPGLLAIAAALLLGLGLTRALVTLDRRALSRRLASGPAATVGPGATAGLAAAAASPGPNTGAAVGTEVAQHPDLLLIVVDALRADALEARGSLPFLTDLARRSVVFERAIAPAPWTVPSMMALMTGRYPSSLDPVGRGRSWPRGFAEAWPLPRAVPRLAGLLSAAGYSTAGFVKNPFLAGGLGFELGFDVFEQVHGDTAEHAAAGQLVEAALRWAEAMNERPAADRQRPWFLYLHFMDPHVNYQPPSQHLSAAARDYVGEVDGRAKTLHDMIDSGQLPPAADVAQLRALYAGEVAYLDGQLARLFDGLTDAGLLDRRTWVVFTADHGEQFGEHGGWLHNDINTENVAVPLMLRGPGLLPQRRADLASLVDLLPTLAGRLGLPSLALGDGRDLFAAAAAARQATAAEGPPGLASSEGLAPAAAEPEGVAELAGAVHTEYGEQQRLTGSRYSLLLGPDGRTSLYDLRDDPTERHDLAESQPDIVAAMLSAMEAHATRTPPVPPAGQPGEGSGGEVDLDVEALQAIGYTGG